MDFFWQVQFRLNVLARDCEGHGAEFSPSQKASLVLFCRYYKFF